jgi:uncharacterized protein DUF3105
VRSIARWRAAAASLVFGGCVSGLPARDGSYDPMPREPMPVDAGADGEGGEIDGAQCAAVIEQHPEEGFTHIACTSATNYQTVPPSSGNHFSCWPEYRTFDVPVPWGNLVHALEHGSVVIVYNCGAAGCPDEVARAQAFIDALPFDSPTCPSTRRVILAPDPTLDVRWAATAWTWTLRADCFDEAAFGQFYTDHYDHGRESICNTGAPYANLCDGVLCI